VKGWWFAAAAVACLLVRWLVSGRQVDATPLLFALAPVNALAFAVRKKLAWTRGPVVHANESKDGLFRGGRERTLRKRYELGPLHAASSVYAYRENLYVLDVLDGTTLEKRDRIRALDVGSQDFRYAFGLARWLGRFAEDVALTGIELEGHRIYDDLHSRKEHAEAFASEVDGATVDYRVADFLAFEAMPASIDVISFFFPFVLEYALVRWGLPRRFFSPKRMFDKAYSLLRPGGTVIVMNHTSAERERQLELLRECGFEVVSSAPAKSELVDYAADVPERSLTVARRPA
jgi:SAM-dependent methyltransferase